jgi:hypothetical protein
MTLKMERVYLSKFSDHVTSNPGRQYSLAGRVIYQYMQQADGCRDSSFVQIGTKKIHVFLYGKQMHRICTEHKVQEGG